MSKQNISVNIDQAEDIKVIEEDDMESLQAWTKNKLRGFKRVDPINQPTNKTPTVPNKVKTMAYVHQSTIPSDNTTPSPQLPRLQRLQGHLLLNEKLRIVETEKDTATIM